MIKIRFWLTGLLMLQLLAAAGLFWDSQHQRQQHRQQALLSFKPRQLNRITIGDKDDDVTITRSGDGWRLPELNNLPADIGKLNGLLEKLQRLKTGWPVATTPGSHERFEVAEDRFRRRIRLHHDETLAAELFIGTSPGFRKSHVRRSVDETVYTAKLNDFELPVKAVDWLDKGLLAAKNINRIKGHDYDLEEGEGNWRFAAVGDAEQAVETAPLNQNKALQLAAALSSLQVQGPVENPPISALSEDKGIHVEISGPEGDWHYRFSKVNDQYFVSRDDRKTVFSLSQFDFERIAQVNRAQLMLTEPEVGAEKSDAGDIKRQARAANADSKDK